MQFPPGKNSRISPENDGFKYTYILLFFSGAMSDFGSARVSTSYCKIKIKMTPPEEFFPSGEVLLI